MIIDSICTQLHFNNVLQDETMFPFLLRRHVLPKFGKYFVENDNVQITINHRFIQLSSI